MFSTQLILFTDLDGTLLDHHTYSWSAAQEALDRIHRRHVPLIFCTSKTHAEVEVLREELGNVHPFITENGGGLFIPHAYFSRHPKGAKRVSSYHLITQARPYKEVVQELQKIALESGVCVVGFHDMSTREIAQNTGLPQHQAELARHREFDEPFLFAGSSPSKKLVKKFIETAAQHGMTVARGGRFWHLFAGTDKGQATRRLIKLYHKAGHNRPHSVGLGDSAADLPMLAAVDLPILLPRPDGSFDFQVVAHLRKVSRGLSPGPKGWNSAVVKVLDSHRTYPLD
jgi:mannosyl-3-phosphoglycerate phosphatase